MRYVINRTIYFRNTDGALWKEDEDDSSSITLTVTTSRLLTYLLERHGEVASRDDILESVWTDYGLRSSNNSLNKYIADLRKIFSQMELTEDVIVTVPTIGFMFSRGIEVEKEYTVVGDKADNQLVYESHHQNVAIENEGMTKKTNRKRYVLLACLILLVGVTPAILSTTDIGVELSEIGKLPQSNVYLLAHIDGCEIYTLQQNLLNTTSVEINIAKKLIKETGLKCLETTRFFFQPSEPVIYGYQGRVFFSRCTYNKDKPDEFSACNNYYGTSYKNEE